MTQDFRFALRMIFVYRWFSLAVVATIALGIGVNTMVFTLIDAVMFKPVPVPGGERLAVVMNHDIKTHDPRALRNVSWPDFLDYRAHANSIEALEAGSGDGVIVSEKDIAPEHYNMFSVSSGFFGMLHVRPVRGRDFAPADGKPGASPVALIGYGIWKERYGGGDVLGRIVRVNGKSAAIIGVMPAGFRFPTDNDLWMPLQAGADLEDRSHRPLQLFAMLKRGVSIAQATAEFEVMAHRLATEHSKDDKDMTAVVETFHQRYSGGQVRVVFSLLMAAGALVLLIACANVANMLLGRALARSREISIRAAMGASRWQLVRQLLIESLVLSLLGGVAGLALAALGVHYFDVATQDVGKPYWILFSIDYRVFFYFAAICVGSALVFGLVPALRSSRDVGGALQEGTRSAGTRHGGRLSGLLVVFQFGLTLVLLLGAAVFMRSFIEKQSVNRWIPADRLTTGRVNLPEERYKDADARRRFFEQLLSRVTAIPGVNGAAIASDLPGTGARTRRIEIEDAPLQDKAHGPAASVMTQFPGYFTAISLPIPRGRDFNTTDGSPGRLCAIVTREFAGRFWGSRGALGKRFRFLDNSERGEWISVIGVSGDIAQRPLDAAPEPLLFLPYRQNASDSMALLVRADNPSSAASAVRRTLQGLDQDLPLYEVKTLAEALNKQIWFLRLFGTIFTVFAAIALVLASVGIYAVMAQATGSRTKEIGVRMAMGATPGHIVGMVLRRGIWQLLAGLALGGAIAFPAARALKSLDFLDRPGDPAIIAAASAMLCGIGLFACWLPARRAARLNPVNAIRTE